VISSAFALACALSLVSPGRAAFAEEAPGKTAEQVGDARVAARANLPTWYAATVAEDEKGGFVMVNFWSKGPRLRSEAVLAGRHIVTFVDETTYYVIDDAAGTGLAIERSAAARAQDAVRGRPFANELADLLRQGGEKIGTEQASGQTVDVYRLTNDSGRRTIWISTTNPPVPLRIETYDRESSTTGKIDYVNWMQNPLLDDDFFGPDPRVELERFGYEEYRKRIRRGPVGPAPVLYRHLLHGEDAVQ
jgi:outer membrane lipoprotein-sorting protein